MHRQASMESQWINNESMLTKYIHMYTYIQMNKKKISTTTITNMWMDTWNLKADCCNIHYKLWRWFVARLLIPIHILYEQLNLRIRNFCEVRMQLMLISAEPGCWGACKFQSYHHPIGMTMSRPRCQQLATDHKRSTNLAIRYAINAFLRFAHRFQPCLTFCVLAPRSNFKNNRKGSSFVKITIHYLSLNILCFLVGMVGRQI